MKADTDINETKVAFLTLACIFRNLSLKQLHFESFKLQQKTSIKANAASVAKRRSQASSNDNACIEISKPGLK